MYSIQEIWNGKEDYLDKLGEGSYVYRVSCCFYGAFSRRKSHLLVPLAELCLSILVNMRGVQTLCKWLMYPHSTTPWFFSSLFSTSQNWGCVTPEILGNMTKSSGKVGNSTVMTNCALNQSRDLTAPESENLPMKIERPKRAPATECNLDL